MSRRQLTSGETVEILSADSLAGPNASPGAQHVNSSAPFIRQVAPGCHWFRGTRTQRHLRQRLEMASSWPELFGLLLYEGLIEGDRSWSPALGEPTSEP